MARTSHAFLVMLAAGLVACSSESGGEDGGDVDRDPPPEGACYQDPIACPDGTTCAFDDENGEAMSCLPAGSGGENDACQNVAGEAQCGEGLACLHLTGTDGGHCAPVCDSNEDCDGGLVCAKVTTEAGHSFYACADV